MEDEINSNNLDFVKKGSEWIVYEKIYEPKKGEIRTKKFNTWLDDVGNNSNGTKELKDLFGNKTPFDYPKPTQLIKRLLEIANVKNSDIIMDFFAGSGTSADAIINFNIQNNLNLNFILIQIPEMTLENSKAYELGFKTIADVCKERIRRVLERNKNKLTNNKQSVGFKVFKLAKSNYKIWEDYDGKNQKELKNQLTFFTNPLIENYKGTNVIYECIIKEGYSLNSKIELTDIETNKVFLVTDEESSFYICLDLKIRNETIDKLQLDKENIFICLDDALNDTKKSNLSVQSNLQTI